jgi:hypothetical protein
MMTKNCMQCLHESQYEGRLHEQYCTVPSARDTAGREGKEPSTELLADISLIFTTTAINLNNSEESVSIITQDFF